MLKDRYFQPLQLKCQHSCLKWITFVRVRVYLWLFSEVLHLMLSIRKHGARVLGMRRVSVRVRMVSVAHEQTACSLVVWKEFW